MKKTHIHKRTHTQNIVLKNLNYKENVKVNSTIIIIDGEAGLMARSHG